jgi:hypothetical protein
LLSAYIYLSPHKTEDYATVGFTRWFNSFDVNNWHGSVRKMKNCNNGKSGKRDFLDYCPAEKSMHFFGKGYCEKCTRKEQYQERKAKKGLIAKINANNLCQRNLF